MPDLPDPHLDSPEQYGSEYIPSFNHRNISWLIRDPDFPHRALMGSVTDARIPRRTVVGAKIFLDFPANEKVGKLDPRYPILAGVLHPTNKFVKGATP